MAGSDPLADLLHELRAAGSPLDRLRHLALAWRTVRELTPEQRSTLGREVGFDGAEELVERLAIRRGGLAPTELLEAVHAARKADPGKLRKLLGDRARQRQLLQDGLRMAAASLEDGTVGGDLPPQAAPTPPEPPPEAKLAEPESAPPPPLQEPEVDVAEEAPTPPPPEPQAPPPEEEPQPAEAPPSPPAPLPPQPEPPAPPVPIATQEPAATRPPDVAIEDSADPLFQTLAGEPSLVRRLSTLRRLAPTLAGPGIASLRRATGCFPQGWARRRALQALFTLGLPDSTSHAIDLVADLAAERDRRWCLAELVSRRALSADELTAACQHLGVDSARRRLQRLARRR